MELNWDCIKSSWCWRCMSIGAIGEKKLVNNCYREDELLTIWTHEVAHHWIWELAVDVLLNLHVVGSSRICEHVERVRRREDVTCVRLEDSLVNHAQLVLRCHVLREAFWCEGGTFKIAPVVCKVSRGWSYFHLQVLAHFKTVVDLALGQTASKSFESLILFAEAGFVQRREDAARSLLRVFTGSRYFSGIVHRNVFSFYRRLGATVARLCISYYCRIFSLGRLCAILLASATLKSESWLGRAVWISHRVESLRWRSLSGDICIHKHWSVDLLSRYRQGHLLISFHCF